LANDDPFKNKPQQIGVKYKIRLLLFASFFYLLELLKENFNEEQLIVNGILVVTLSLFSFIMKKTINIILFWVETFNFWWLMVVFL
jgi:hypothetical protein